jgi:hypothetical protein
MDLDEEIDEVRAGTSLSGAMLTGWAQIRQEREEAAAGGGKEDEADD